MTVKGIIIEPDGSYAVKDFKPDGDGGVYSELRKLFDDELVDIFKFQLGFGYVDDNGIQKELTPNPIATALYWGAYLEDGQPLVSVGGAGIIVGRAVVFGPVDPGGSETDVSDELLALVEALTKV